MSVGVAEARISREDVRSAIGARRELGDDLEPEVIDAFIGRVERAIDARVENRLTEARRPHGRHGLDGSRLALAIVSLGTGIPITAIAAEAGGVVGIVAAWVGIAGVNYAHGHRRD
jgi:hypothetical protein